MAKKDNLVRTPTNHIPICEVAMKNGKIKMIFKVKKKKGETVLEEMGLDEFNNLSLQVAARGSAQLDASQL